MSKILTGALVLVMMLSGTRQGFGWSAPGHMVVAGISWQQLSSAEQAAATALLQSHPAHKHWVKDYNADTPTGISLDLYCYLRASLYPDDIRDEKDPSTHPHWHFVDYPLHPPDFKMEKRPAPIDDVIFGISQSEKGMGTGEAPDRAVYFSFLLHLVGDIHQPLHCESLYNADFTSPEGDRGGNFTLVIDKAHQDHSEKLHAFWDQLFGAGSVPPKPPTAAMVVKAMKDAKAIATALPRNKLEELAQHKKPEDWSLESRDEAVHDGYLDGKLQYGFTDEHSKTVKAAVDLPDGYYDRALALAKRRVALAGDRLADEIHRLKIAPTP